MERPTVKKVGEDLKKRYPQLKHIICVVHVLYNVAELARKEFPKDKRSHFRNKKMLLNTLAKKTELYCFLRNCLTSSIYRHTLGNLVERS
uniref:Putative LOC100898811 [Metaseiulus occidentalis] n=1 Tax=Lepeophtheirus salmonis TaxID=72036 RepID=A0A0K2V959_LEPSM